MRTRNKHTHTRALRAYTPRERNENEEVVYSNHQLCF